VELEIRSEGTEKRKARLAEGNRGGDQQIAASGPTFSLHQSNKTFI